MCDRRIASHRAVSAAVFAVMLMLSPVSGAPARGFTIGANFTGTDKVAELDASFAETGGPGGTFSFPPDTMGAVGPNHVAELINGAFAVYDKVGAIQTRSTLKKFWDDAFTASGGGLTSNNPFDPRLLYDKHSGKWYAVAVDSRDSFGSRVLVAVTTGDDPGPVNWRGFAIDADSAGTRWADFPTIGLDADGLYISNNMIDVQGGPSLSTDVTIMGVPKASLTAAVPSIGGFKKQELVGGSSSTGFSVQPALDVDNSGLALPALSAFNNNNLKRSAFPVGFFPGGTLDTSGPFIPTAGQGSLPNAPQPGTSAALETNDNRFSGNVVLQNGSLWAVQGVVNGGRNAIRWYEIDANTNAINQTGEITDPSLHLYYPSIAVNDFEDVVIGFSGSDSNTFVSSYAVVGDTEAGTTTFGPVTLLHAGSDEYEQKDGRDRNRWGDYSATVVDPTNELRFWTFQEFVAPDRAGQIFPLQDNNWAIRITEIRLPEPASSALLIFGGVMALARRRKRAD